MTKSKRQRQTNTFVRGVRGEAALRAYTTALSYFMTRPHDVAIKLTEERIAHHREELRTVNELRQAAAAKVQA